MPRARRVVVDVDDVAHDPAPASAYVPARETFTSGVDLRGCSLTQRGGKRKRDANDDEDERMDDVDGVEDDFRSYKAPKSTHESVPGKKSGRAWKRPASRASALGKPASGKSWEDRVREREAKKRFVEAKADAKRARGLKIKAERERREELKVKKEANRIATGMGQRQTITNAKTIAKKSAKERAKLKKLRML